MAIHADGLTDAINYMDTVLAAVLPDNVTIVRPPTPDTPVAPPAVFMQLPEPTDNGPRLGCARRAVTIPLLLVSTDTTGQHLLALTDVLLEGLAGYSIATTWAAAQYQPPQTPAPLPAVLITAS